MTTAIVNPRKILLDTINSSKINSTYRIEGPDLPTPQYPTGSKKSFGAAKLVKNSVIKFNNVDCVCLQMHSTLINNGPGALFPGNSSNVVMIDSLTGASIGSSQYASNVFGELNLQGVVSTTLNSVWMIDSLAATALPTTFTAGVAVNGLIEYTPPYKATNLKYELYAPKLSTRPRMLLQFDPYTTGQKISAVGLSTSTNLIITTEPTTAYVPSGIRYIYSTSTLYNNKVVLTYNVEYHINMSKLTLDRIVSGAYVYQNGLTPRYDTVTYTKLDNF